MNEEKQAELYVIVQAANDFMDLSAKRRFEATGEAWKTSDRLAGICGFQAGVDWQRNRHVELVKMAIAAAPEGGALSDRLRGGCECAEWVVDEIAKLEKRLEEMSVAVLEKKINEGGI